jgi:hypothetical protein
MTPAVSTTEEKVPVTISPTTSGGHPASVDGPLSFDILDGGATVEYDPAAAQLSFFLVSEDVAGISHVRLRADADLGAGVRELTEVFEYTYGAAEAASLGISVGTPVPK